MEFITQLHAHRSIRHYQPDPVPEEVLEEILDAAIRTSSSGNMQTYSIIVTDDDALREKLLEPHLKQRMVVEAPLLLTFCADFHRMRRWLQLHQAPDNFDNFFGFMVGAIDAVLASQTAALAAESLGLGICYLGSTLSNSDRIADILQLPANVVPVVGFTLGYPDEDPQLRDRLPREGLVHRNRYQEYSDRKIQEIYREKEVQGWERYMNSARLRRLVKEAGVETLAELYTTVKYTREGYQEISRRLLTTLQRQDFMNNGGE